MAYKPQVKTKAGMVDLDLYVNPDNFNDSTKWLTHQSTQNEVGNNNRPLILFGSAIKNNSGQVMATTDDIPNWAKAATKPTYSYSELVGDSFFSAKAGAHINENGTPTVTLQSGVFTFDYLKGGNGFSCFHSWDGTKLSVTSASGTSSADLKGPKGDKGDTGATGPQGPKGDTGDGISKITFAKLMDNNSYYLSQFDYSDPTGEFLIIPTYDNSTLTITGLTSKGGSSGTSKSVTVNQATGLRLTSWGIYISGQMLLSGSFKDAKLSCGSTRFHIYKLGE